MRLLSFVILILGFQASADNGVKEKPFYGDEIKSESATSLDSVLKDYAKYEKSSLVMEANVEKVCAAKGCWMTLQGSDKTFRVKFKDYGFFVPMTLVGKKVWVEGMMNRKEISVKDTKHYLEDAGATKEEIAAVTEPSFEYSIVAKGVKVVQ
ncbi:MAG: DUF4920 domain-containing protein [Bdellovibrionales bacterium]|nr:DUF4920 domain-containing protein [Bdellovibrionales bacterium]